jgi:hypothetical protein
MAMPLPPAKVVSGTPAVVSRSTENAVVGPGVFVVLPLQLARPTKVAMIGTAIRLDNFPFIWAPFAGRSLVQSGQVRAYNL